MTEEAIAGIDVGGTKTQIMVARGRQTIADRTLPTESWRVLRMDEDSRTLADTLRPLCGGVAPAALAIGSHGCDSGEECERFQASLTAALGTRVLVVNDAELLVPAAGYDEGVGLVAGTGSIAVARDRGGAMLAAGGWGWILGDEGSAPGLVREAARAVRAALDQGASAEPPAADPLIAALLQAIGTDDPTKLGRLLNATRSAAAWGTYANAVFAAADAGSVLGRRVIDEAGVSLAGLVETVVRRGASAARVVAAGGVIVTQPLLLEAFRVALRRALPATDTILLREPPVVGALALARRLLRPASHG